MGLKTYIIKRIIYSVLLLFFVITLNFIIFELMPGNPMEFFMSPARLRAGQPEQMMELWGLTQPLHVKYIKYVSNMLTGQFGISYLSMSPVADEMTARLTNTLSLVGISTILSIILGVSLGVLAAYKRGGIFDSGSVVTALALYSVPSFWLGMMFLLVFSFKLHWFPSAGTHPIEWAMNWPAPLFTIDILGAQISIPGAIEILGRLRHLALPVFALTLFMYGGYLLVTRATMLETLTEDYVVTARAKGLSERMVLYKHALKNASLPIITNIALSLAYVISGAIITEQVFTYPGIGKWTWDAIAFYDYPVLQTVFFIIAFLVIIANFVADVVYGIIDPRIKYR